MSERSSDVADKLSKLKAQLSEFSFNELRDIQAWLGMEIDHRQEEELIALRQRIRGDIEKSGFSLDQVMDEMKPLQVNRRASVKKVSGDSKLAPKYQHPDEPHQVWSGRGRPPKWYQQLKEEGVEPKLIES